MAVSTIESVDAISSSGTKGDAVSWQSHIVQCIAMHTLVVAADTIMVNLVERSIMFLSDPVRSSRFSPSRLRLAISACWAAMTCLSAWLTMGTCLLARTSGTTEGAAAPMPAPALMSMIAGPPTQLTTTPFELACLAWNSCTVQTTTLSNCVRCRAASMYDSHGA